MTMSAEYDPATEAGSGITVQGLVTLAMAGAFATIVFDYFGQSLSPMLGFANLAPVPLATQTWGVVFGQPWSPGGHLLHYVAGLIAYPIGWAFIARPIAAKVTPQLSEWLVAVAYGIGLWIFALYIMAHLVAGNPAFLGFTGITWVALIGHVIYALALLVALKWLDRR